MKRRSFVLGAAAVATSATSACALPARLLEDDAPVLDVVPCDGRSLRICDYEKLFEVLQPTCSWSYDTQMFRVPDLRARVFDAQGLLARGDEQVVAMHIGTGYGRLPAGVVIPMVVTDASR